MQNELNMNEAAEKLDECVHPSHIPYIHTYKLQYIHTHIHMNTYTHTIPYIWHCMYLKAKA